MPNTKPCWKSSKNKTVKRTNVFLLTCVLICMVPGYAQREKRQPLNERQIEQIREAGVFPDQRVHLYTGFIAEKIDSIDALGKRGKSSARTSRLDETLMDLAALADELSSNLDQYGERKADLRKSLKGLNEALPHWTATLRELAAEPGFDLSRKEALDSLADLSELATQMEKEQNAYFEAHKDERGQQRAEPK